MDVLQLHSLTITLYELGFNGYFMNVSDNNSRSMDTDVTAAIYGFSHPRLLVTITVIVIIINLFLYYYY